MQNSTFGIEAEFQVGAENVIANLHAQGMAGDPMLHGYHCDCPTCGLGNEYPLKGQTDSSCSGEIISDILTFDGYPHPFLSDSGHDSLAVMEAIQEAAIAVDAEPGMTSGLHVHVGHAHIIRYEELKANAFLAYLKWEPLLTKLATGRWQEMRSGNYALRDGLFRKMQQMLSGAGIMGERQWSTWFAHVDSEQMVGAYDNPGTYLYGHHYEADRHSFLNVRTNNPTWEFRLWNSTRSAWRMEMYARTSIAMMDPAVSQRLLDESYPQRLRRETLNRFGNMLADCGHSRASELIDKQAYYLGYRASNAPSSLTTTN